MLRAAFRILHDSIDLSRRDDHRVADDMASADLARALAKVALGNGDAPGFEDRAPFGGRLSAVENGAAYHSPAFRNAVEPVIQP
jgi:hypothetical protein